MDTTEVYDRIRARIDELYPDGMSDQKASLIVSNGKNKDLIRGLKRGRTKFPRGDHLTSLAAFLEKPVEWLIGPGSHPKLGQDLIPHSPNAQIGEKISGREIGALVPLYGSAVGGVEGEFVLNGNVLDRIAGPVSLAFVKGAYAVTVSGESMLPRYEDGETAFVNPNVRVKRGDYVVAQIQEDEHGPILAYVKRFVRRNSEELVLEQLNPAKELRFPANNVVAVHYVLRGGE